MLISIIEQALMALPLLIGAYIILSLLKLPDFSIESAYLCGAVGAYLAVDLPLPLMLLATIGGGITVGLIVSLLNQFYAIPFLLAAIVVNGFCHGATQYLLGGAMVRFNPALELGEGQLLVIIAMCLLIAMPLLLRSQFGYCLAIFGNNPSFFHHHGISSRYVVFGGVMIGHACAAMSGFLFARSNGFVDLTMQTGIILLCLTALMIGKIVLRSRLQNIFVPLIGIVIYFILQQLLLRMGLDLRYFNALQAFAVLLLLIAGRKKQVLTPDHLGV